MKQNIPMPVVIGVVVVIAAIAIGFVFMRGNSTEGGFDPNQSRKMQEEAYKRKTQGGGGTAPGGNASQTPSGSR